MWRYYNPNPLGRSVGDCAVRAVSAALNISWEEAYSMLASNGYLMGDMPQANSVIAATLRKAGFYKTIISDSCPDCYTAEMFCRDHPHGVYVLGFGTHVATVVDGGILLDSWDSSQEVPIFYFYRKDD